VRVQVDSAIFHLRLPSVKAVRKLTLTPPPLAAAVGGQLDDFHSKPRRHDSRRQISARSDYLRRFPKTAPRRLITPRGTTRRYGDVVQFPSCPGGISQFCFTSANASP